MDNSQEQIENLEDSIQIVEFAFKELKENEKLKRLLTYLLAFGNYLNGTSNRGGAYGFSLNSLPKVWELKN